MTLDTSPPNSLPTIAVVSGGTAGNALLGAFENIPHRRIYYCLPISDNGGSTSEIIRVLGGPGIGDLRSRLLRLIPPEEAGIKALLNHRLDDEGDVARQEFSRILEGDGILWHGISSEKREVLRSFLRYVSSEITKRSRPGSSFRFSRASIGNLVLTGARLFLGSLESAIYLVASVGRCPPHSQVLPVLNTNFTHHIAARLENGQVVVGQNQISHPSAPSAASNAGLEATAMEDANLPGSHPHLRMNNIAIEKTGHRGLPSRISGVHYINPYGQPIHPRADPKVLQALASSGVIVYSCGSLFTSIMPCLVLGGVGETIAASRALKILLLNGSLDRETEGFTAADFIHAITRGASQTTPQALAPSSVITHLIYIRGGERTSHPRDVPLDAATIAGLGIEAIASVGERIDGELRFVPELVGRTIRALLGGGPHQRRRTLNS